MDRILKVHIDRTTWPNPGIPPLFPKSFKAGLSSYNLNIPAMLMMIGYLTTPTSSTGVSLSEFWAWVRYLAAISNQADLSLTQTYSELDAHQKTILSDDFGMGVPILWLCDKLSLVQIVDGRYFMERIAPMVGVTQRRTAKRGPNKTPDFLARDAAGKWHIIECKGTQSGSEFSEKQLGTKGPPPTGGIAQKCSIRFPPSHTGQRLVCGLSIGVEGRTGSVLKIIDPEPEDPFEVETDQLIYAEDAANRGVISRVLRMSGFEVTAESVASPFGSRPDATRAASARAESARKKMVEERDQKSRREIRSIVGQRLVFDGNFRGREIPIELPREIWVNEEPVRKVILRQGVCREALEELEQKPSVEDLADNKHVSWTQLIGRNVVETDRLSATMRIGDIFRSEIILAP
ncbi:hypothetical protein [Azonexus sp. R2A61]|uniref:hypothetical protein n=1 Tax=Azonexus sp. R2A61 TaxID=2744443 RepID=UPI001F436ABF|nr:hypothetical protein [Azonexus sp. R2A61]